MLRHARHQSSSESRGSPRRQPYGKVKSKQPVDENVNPGQSHTDPGHPRERRLRHHRHSSPTTPKSAHGDAEFDYDPIATKVGSPTSSPLVSGRLQEIVNAQATLWQQDSRKPSQSTDGFQHPLAKQTTRLEKPSIIVVPPSSAAAKSKDGERLGTPETVELLLPELSNGPLSPEEIVSRVATLLGLPQPPSDLPVDGAQGSLDLPGKSVFGPGGHLLADTDSPISSNVHHSTHLTSSVIFTPDDEMMCNGFFASGTDDDSSSTSSEETDWLDAAQEGGLLERNGFSVDQDWSTVGLSPRDFTSELPGKFVHVKKAHPPSVFIPNTDELVYCSSENLQFSEER